jgi:hypothetical protein
MKFSIETKKKKLEKAIKSALYIAQKEKLILNQDFAEENLRYIVMTEISKVKCFGQFPNIKASTNRICFEKCYKYLGSTEDEDRNFYPDIVSLKSTINEAELTQTHNLVVELKINSHVSGIKDDEQRKTLKKKDLKQRIGSLNSSLEQDILKTRIYLERKYDDYTFEIGVVIILGFQNKKEEGSLSELEKILVEQQNELRKISEKHTFKNLLFGWFNPKINEPELFWLNQKEKISIQRNKKSKFDSFYQWITKIFTIKQRSRN